VKPAPLIFVFPLLAAGVFAAETPLTWEDVARRAREANPTLAAATLDYQAAMAGTEVSANGFLPRLSASGGYSRSGSSGQSAVENWQAGLDAAWDVFHPGTYFSHRQVRMREIQAEAQALSTEIGVRRDALGAFAALLYAQEQIGTAERILALRDQAAQVVALKYGSGREFLGNHLQSQAERADAAAQRDQSLRDRHTARVALARLMGAGDPEVLAVTGTVAVPALSTAPETGALLEAHPDWTLARARWEESRADVGEARSDFWPVLSLTGDRSWTGTSFFPSDPSWSAGARLSLPLFQQGISASYHNVDRARARRDAQRARLEETRWALRDGIESAWSDYAATRDQLAVREKFLAAARQRNEEAFARYTAGRLAFENWEPIVTALASAERQALAARRDAALAQAGWEWAAARTLEER
jgi:outer membrane protein TolC